MKKLLWLFTFLLWAATAHAQFADQRTYVGNSGGAANAQTLAIPNYALNAGVELRFVPNFTNTGALTLNVNSTGAVNVLKSTAAGLIALTGGEVQLGVLAQVVFDGAQYELMPPVSNWCGTSTGSANIQACNNVSYFNTNSGQALYFLAGFTNTSSATLNGVPIYKDTLAGAVALTGGEIVAGNVVGVTYDGTIPAFHLQSYAQVLGFSTQTTLASATTTSLGTIVSHNIAISGTTTITSFGSAASLQSPLYLLQFASALQITESAALLTPSLQNITTATGDSAWALYLGSSNWQIIQYMPAASAQAYVQPPQFRLSTTSGNPISTASGTGVGTVYAALYNGNLIPLWNGTYFIPTACPQMSNVLANSAVGNAGPAAAVAASVYDLVAWNNNGACTLTRDVAWTNVTTPAAGDAFARVNGILVNSVAITNGPGVGYGTYLGTIATDAAGATVTFNPTPAAASGGPTNGAWVGVWNEFNRVLASAEAQDSKSSWTYGTATWRSSDNSANNRVTFVVGNIEDSVSAQFSCAMQGGTGGIGYIGIGFNSTTTPFGAVVGTAYASYGGTTATASQAPSLGQNYIQALEFSNSVTNTFFGTGATGSPGQTHELSAQLRY